MDSGRALAHAAWQGHPCTSMTPDTLRKCGSSRLARVAKPLPPLPTTKLEVVTDTPPDQGFLRVRRQQLRARFPDGSVSAPFAYDQVERTALDAVVIAAHFRDRDGVLQIFLRSALRPPVAHRKPEICPIPERPTLGHLWELPAGLVETSEQTEQGLRTCAARELGEELGFQVAARDMLPLGPSTFPAPSVLGERHFYFHCRVDPATQHPPSGDGSPLERHAAIVAIPLADALHWMSLGEIEDAKTEIALRRLAEIEP